MNDDDYHSPLGLAIRPWRTSTGDRSPHTRSQNPEADGSQTLEVHVVSPHAQDVHLRHQPDGDGDGQDQEQSLATLA